ncbi:MAG TPA: ribonuclease P protein component [Bacteroidales bacterium]|nr:ribonuclease P protein component [Bacteroidales bacterium]
MITTRETFRKAERLCSRKTIEYLFGYGNSFYTAFFKVIWAETELNSPFPARVALMVPKKGISRAVSRNLLKRRMKEAYRRNKYFLYEFLNSENIRIALIVIFRKEKVEEYTILETAVNELLNKLIKTIKQSAAK